MSKIVWTLFGITLSVVAALGASALGLIPGPTGQGGAPRIIVEMDGKASALQGSLGKLRAERDRLAADLSAKEADRKAMMEDLADAMGQRDEMRQQLDNTQRQLELLAKAVPEQAKNPASAPVESAPLDAPEAAPRAATGFKSEDEGASAATQSNGTLVPEAGPPEAAVPEPAGTQLAAVDPARALVRGLRAYREEDYRLAFYTWLPLAHAGDPRAQFYVGGLYTEGRGVEANQAMAYVWLRRAERGGYHRAKALLDRLAGGMTRNEMTAAERNVAK